MAVIFKKTFTAADIRRFVTLKVEHLENIIVDQFSQVGEQFIIDARSLNTYTDRTGNLRASIGYAIFKNGKLLQDDFTGKAEGRKTGRTLAKEFGKTVPKGYALVVVAGMFYAGYVEAKGYDVITGPGIKASRNIKRALNRVSKGLSKLSKAA